MSTSNNVSILAATPELLPKPKVIRKMFARHTDYSFDEFDGFADDADLDIVELHRPAGDPQHGWCWRGFSWNSKWTTGGLRTFAAALSTRYPGVTVKVLEEWDNRDADESGAERYEYLNGELVEDLVAQLAPVDLAKLVANAKAERDNIAPGGYDMTAIDALLKALS